MLLLRATRINAHRLHKILDYGVDEPAIIAGTRAARAESLSIGGELRDCEELGKRLPFLFAVKKLRKTYSGWLLRRRYEK